MVFILILIPNMYDLKMGPTEIFYGYMLGTCLQLAPKVPATLVKFGVGLSTPSAKFGALVNFRSALQWGKKS